MTKRRSSLPDTASMSVAELDDLLAQAEEVQALAATQHHEPISHRHSISEAKHHTATLGWATPQQSADDPANMLANDPAYGRAIERALRRNRPERIASAITSDGHLGYYGEVAQEHGITQQRVQQNCEKFVENARIAINVIAPLPSITAQTPMRRIKVCRKEMQIPTVALDLGAIRRISARSQQMQMPPEYTELVERMDIQEQHLQTLYRETTGDSGKRQLLRRISQLQDAQKTLPQTLEAFLDARIATLNPIHAGNPYITARASEASLDLRDALTDGKNRIPTANRNGKSSEAIVLSISYQLDALVQQVRHEVRQTSAEFWGRY